MATKQAKRMESVAMRVSTVRRAATPRALLTLGPLDAKHPERRLQLHYQGAV